MLSRQWVNRNSPSPTANEADLASGNSPLQHLPLVAARSAPRDCPILERLRADTIRIQKREITAVQRRASSSFSPNPRVRDQSSLYLSYARMFPPQTMTGMYVACFVGLTNPNSRLAL